MSENKWLGKIEKIEFGYGGYQDAMFGLSVTISGTYGVNDFKGTWSTDITPGENHKWTEEDRRIQNDELVKYANGLVKSAKVQTISQLFGVPVEVTSDGNRMQSWRILTEVL